MKLERHLKLSTPEASASRIRVAFATRDKKHIDQHFGSACAFMIYSVTLDSYELIEVAEFAETEQDKNHSKLLTKLELLHGCVAVYSNAVGNAAVKQLMSLGVQPIRCVPGTSIAGEIARLQQDWRTDPPSWLAKLTKPAEEGRFDLMEEEGWQE